MIYSAMRVERKEDSVKLLLSGDHCADLQSLRLVGKGFKYILIGGRGVGSVRSFEGVSVRLTANGNTAVECPREVLA